jgi:YD repeat-containing protein
VGQGWSMSLGSISWSQQNVTAGNGVNSTWKYQYYLNGLSSKPCATCAWGNTWGNQNDVDAADYYNGQFTSYAETVVTNPDSTSQINYFASTPGWGLATSGITCYVPGGNCNVTPFWNEDPAAAGRLKTQENFDASGALMQVTQNQYTMNCPPAGVAGSQNAAGAPYDPGNHYLFSELDKNNPVVVCDPRISQQDTYQVDGVTNIAGYQGDARVVHKTVNTSYDGDNRGVGGYDYGNVNTVDTTSNDVGGFHFIQNTAYYPNDNINGLVYLTDLPAFVTNQDGAGTYFGCTAMVYGNNASAPHAPNVPSVSQQIGYPNQSGGCAPPTISTQHAYNNSGNPIAATDADGHLGCTMNGAQYSACASYDGFQTHLTQALNAKNQAANYHYDTGLASGGYGQWLLASSDANGQMTSYSYDVLGRLTSVVQPGDTASAPTTSYVYTNTCTVGITVPCLRLDTVTRVSGASTTTTRQWFDGMGQLVQTQTPGPNASANVLVTYTIYDDLGRPTDQSLPYAIANPSNAYVTPDRNQARTDECNLRWIAAENGLQR